jgi:hypothetical protein
MTFSSCLDSLLFGKPFWPKKEWHENFSVSFGGEMTMKRSYASHHPTLIEIADVFGVPADTVLKWIIEGRLLVALQGAQTIMMVDKNQSPKNPIFRKILILTKNLSNQKWQAFSC